MKDRLLLRPTPEQYQAFADYLPDAHSWYKHLPLIGGRWFVVFVAPNAGLGRLVAVPHRDSTESEPVYTLETPPEGAEFTDEHPRLHYSWTTTKEYRRRFGYLDYMTRSSPDEPYDRDVGLPLELPASLEERCSFVLYPYVSGFAEAITWSIHRWAVERLRAGAAHPAREQVLELASLAKTQEGAGQALEESERDWVLAHYRKPISEDASIKVRRYLELQDRIRAVDGSLYAQEAEKIRRALAALDEWLLQGG